MIYDKNNVFYKIIHGELKSNLILDEKNFIAINDIAPRAPIHILVIPKGEYVDYYDFITNASQEEILDLNRGVAEIVAMKKLDKTGFRLLSNSKKTWNQEIMHFHFHVMGNAA